MALIAILLGIVIERYLGSLEEMRRFDWFDQLTRWVRGLSWGNSTAGVAVTAVVPVLGVLLVNALLGAIWGGFAFLFALLVLLYSFGPRDLEAEVEAFLEARDRGDEEAAFLHATDLLATEEIADSGTLGRVLLEAVLVEANERFLGVVFWFLVLGPVGALLYRLAWLLCRICNDDSPFAFAARRLHHILAWLPARLTALGYALSGSFVDAMHQWRVDATTWGEESRGVLVSSGFGALRYRPVDDAEIVPDRATEDSYIREALALVRRTAIAWLFVLAVFTLAGWLT